MSKQVLPVAKISDFQQQDRLSMPAGLNRADEETTSPMMYTSTQREGSSRDISHDNLGGAAGVARRLVRKPSSDFRNQAAGELPQPDGCPMERFLADHADYTSERSFGWGGHPPNSAAELMDYISKLQYNSRDPPEPSPSSVVRFHAEKHRIR